MAATPLMHFERDLAVSLPATADLLRSANLTIHPNVSRIILHGSRGPAGGSCSDSDIDLSLIVDLPQETVEPQRGQLLRRVLETTLEHWHATVEPDLAAVFDVQNCGLKCFDHPRWNAQLCAHGGADCFGLYKIQGGYNGQVTNAGVQVKMMYPCLKIWQRGQE